MARCLFRVLGVLMGGLGAAAARGDAPPPLPPLHPTAIMATYKDHPCVVVGVSGANAVVESHGDTVRLPSSATFDPARAKAFMPGSIEVKGQNASSRRVTNRLAVFGRVNYDGGESTNYDGGVASAESEYDASIVASQAYRGCYLVLVFFDPDFLAGRSDSPGATLTFQNIGDVAAGAETPVKTSFGYLDRRRRSVDYLPLFFSRGAEIRTNLSEGAARLFRRMELLRHKALVDVYLAKNPRTRMPARTYLRFPPVFPPGIDRAAIPAKVKVDFTVTPEGTVEDVAFSQALPADVSVEIGRAVGGWLFLPKLADGQPVGISLSMEITFED